MSFEEKLMTEIERRWPEDSFNRKVGASLVRRGEATLPQLAEKRKEAKNGFQASHERLQGAIMACRELGPSELARRTGLSRVTVSKILKKED